MIGGDSGSSWRHTDVAEARLADWMEVGFTYAMAREAIIGHPAPPPATGRHLASPVASFALSFPHIDGSLQLQTLRSDVDSSHCSVIDNHPL